MVKAAMLSLLAFVILFACACSDRNAGTRKSTPVPALSAPAKELPVSREGNDLYIEVSALNRLEYFKNHELGIRLASEAFGVATEYVGPQNYDLEAIKREFRRAIKRQPSGIAVIGFDSSLTDLVNEAVHAGIPVVTVDSDLPGSDRMAFVGTGNHQAGYEGALKLAELIGGVGKIAIMSLPGQPNLDERVQGYQDALRHYPGIEIVSVINTKSDSDVAAEALAKVLAEHPDLAGIGCVEAASGAGAINVMNRTGNKGRIKIVAMDNDQEVIAGIQEGVISATVVQQTALMSFYAIQILYNHHHGLPSASLDHALQKRGTPMMIDTGVVIVDKNNYKKILQNSG